MHECTLDIRRARNALFHQVLSTTTLKVRALKKHVATDNVVVIVGAWKSGNLSFNGGAGWTGQTNGKQATGVEGTATAATAFNAKAVDN